MATNICTISTLNFLSHTSKCDTEVRLFDTLEGIKSTLCAYSSIVKDNTFMPNSLFHLQYCSIGFDSLNYVQF